MKSTYGNSTTEPITRVPFAYLEGDRITALISYYGTAAQGVDYATVYSLKYGMPTPELYPSNPDLGDDVLRLRSVNRPTLIPFDGEISKFDGLFRIDDDRPGKNMSYLVWLPEPDTELTVPSFVPGAVYGFYPNGDRDDQQEGDFPSSISREELVAMMAEAGIKPITSTAELPGNPEPGSILKATGLRVWDMAAMFRP